MTLWTVTFILILVLWVDPWINRLWAISSKSKEIKRKMDRQRELAEQRVNNPWPPVQSCPWPPLHVAAAMEYALLKEKEKTGN